MLFKMSPEQTGVRDALCRRDEVGSHVGDAHGQGLLAASKIWEEIPTHSHQKEGPSVP